MLSLGTSFEFIGAKTHGMRSRVCEGDRLEELCDLRTVAQLWHRLCPEATPGDHRGLQRRLLADHVRTLETIRRFLPADLVGIYTWMMQRFQIENLKVLLRAWKAKVTVAEIVPFLAPLEKDLQLDASAFVRAEGLAEFIALIPDGALRAAADKGAASYADTGQTFFVEAALDGAYYAGLLARQRALPEPHAAGTDILVRDEIAACDILALFRLKLNYGLRYEQATRFLIPGARHAVALDRLFAFPDFGDMVSFLPRDLLPVGDTRPILTIADLERALWQRLLQVANRHFYHRVGDLGTAVAFYTIKRVELANLFHIIEGVRYEMSPGAIRQGLIRSR
jgi:vacuolar-type H+-ATPase subunit C/Vma6